MASHRYHRCHHCRVVYTYQASGPNAPPYNYDRYCPSCYEVVLTALRDVPPKVEKVLIPVAEVLGNNKVTFDMVLGWARENEREDRECEGQRVLTPLFDLEGNRVQKTVWVRGRDSFVGWAFHFSYWEGEENVAEIKVEMERNLETGKLSRWRNFY